MQICARKIDASHGNIRKTTETYSDRHTLALNRLTVLVNEAKLQSTRWLLNKAQRHSKFSVEDLQRIKLGLMGPVTQKSRRMFDIIHIYVLAFAHARGLNIPRRRPRDKLLSQCCHRLDSLRKLWMCRFGRVDKISSWLGVDCLEP